MPLTYVSKTENGWRGSAWYECQCCPYGYHIDLDFVRYCESIDRSPGGHSYERSGSMRRRQDRRRQRQSMEVLLGLNNNDVPMEYPPPPPPSAERNLAPVVEAGAPSMVTSLDDIKNSLNDVVHEFEQTLQRTKGKQMQVHNLPDVTAVSALAQQQQSFTNQQQQSFTNHHQQHHNNHRQLPYRHRHHSADHDDVTRNVIVASMTLAPPPPPLQLEQPHASSLSSAPPIVTTATSSGEERDFDAVSIESATNLSPGALQNIRTQMALSLERTRHLEELVKGIPYLQEELDRLRHDNGRLTSECRRLEAAVAAAPAAATETDAINRNYIPNTAHLQPPTPPIRACVCNAPAHQPQRPPPPQLNAYLPHRDTGIMATVLTRTVAVGSQVPLLRMASTQTTAHAPKPVITFDTHATQTPQTPEKLVLTKHTQATPPATPTRTQSTHTTPPTTHTVACSDHTVLDQLCTGCLVPRTSVGVGTEATPTPTSSALSLSTLGASGAVVLPPAMGARSRTFHLGEGDGVLGGGRRARSATVACQASAMRGVDKACQQTEVAKRTVAKATQYDTVAQAHKQTQHQPSAQSRASNTPPKPAHADLSVQTSLVPPAKPKPAHTDVSVQAALIIATPPPPKPANADVSVQAALMVTPSPRPAHTDVSVQAAPSVTVIAAPVSARTVLAPPILAPVNTGMVFAPSRIPVPKTPPTEPPPTARVFRRQDTYTKLPTDDKIGLSGLDLSAEITPATTTSASINEQPTNEQSEHASITAATSVSTPPPPPPRATSATTTTLTTAASPHLPPPLAQSVPSPAFEKFEQKFILAEAAARGSAAPKVVASSPKQQMQVVEAVGGGGGGGGGAGGGALRQTQHQQQQQQQQERARGVPSREMQAAIKVLNDSLQRSSTTNNSSSSTTSSAASPNLRSAHQVVEREWFRVSSLVGADPLDVEAYLDYLDEVSGHVLQYVVNMVDTSGNTAMHYSVSHGNFDVVSILLDSKVCDINRQNLAGYTSIMLVSLAEVRSATHASVVRRLFALADVNVRAKGHGQTALMLAVSHGRVDMVAMLLEAGADINIQDDDGSTALMCAAEHGHVDIVRLFLAQTDCDSGVVDVDGCTALKIAMDAGHRHIGVLLYAHERKLHSGPPSAGPPTPPTLFQRRRVSSGGSSGAGPGPHST